MAEYPHLVALAAWPLVGPGCYTGVVARVLGPGIVEDVARCEHRHLKRANAKACAELMARTLKEHPMTTDAPAPDVATSELDTAARAHRRAKIRLETTRAALYDAIRTANAAGQSVRTIAATAEVSIGMVQDAIAGAKGG